MKVSGDLVIGRSGDRKSELNAETRRHGEDRKTRPAEDWVIGETFNAWLPERARRVEHGETSASRRTPAKLIPQNADSGSSRDTFAQPLFRSVWKLFRATLREIFDESAYDRFLLRTNASRSVASYRAFTRERDAAMLKKPRCC
jgi:hypothetical protein